MSKVAGFIIGAIEIGVGAATSNPLLIEQGVMTVVSQAIVDLTAAKQPARQASEMTIALGEQPRVLLVGETFTPGSLVDGFDYGGKYGTDWEVLIIRLADHKCHSLTGFFVNDDYNLYKGDGLVGGKYDDQLEIYFRADTTTTPLPAIVTDHGKGWTAADIGESGCDVIVAYKADKEKDKHPGWPGGRPRFGFVVKGAYCYDPRLDDTVPGGSGPHRDDDPATWEWSENAVICRYKWVRGVYVNDDTSDPTKLLIGRGLSAIEAPPENIIAAANACDEDAAAIAPAQWVATDAVARALTPDTTTLLSVFGSRFAAFYLPTRTELVSTLLTRGNFPGAPIAATAGGVYYSDSAGGVSMVTPTGVETQVVDNATLGMLGAGCGYAAGAVWVYPSSFSPHQLARVGITDNTFTPYLVNFNTTHVFTSAAGGAIAVGSTTGNIIAIGPAGATGALIDTSAYGTSGAVYGFDPDDGLHYLLRQGSYNFLVTKTGTPTIALAVDTGGSPANLYESFAATPVGAATFWNGSTEYSSADLSALRSFDASHWSSGGSGGFEQVGYFYSPINNALLSGTNSAAGIIFRFLDQNGSYRVAGPIYSTQQFIDVEGLFAAATAGNLVTRSGSIELAPGIAQSVVASFTDADLLIGSKVSWNQGFLSEANQEWVNTVVPKYVEPDQKWNDHEAPPARVAADIVADGKPREAQLTLRLVRYLGQAQRVAEINRRLGRRWGRASVTLGPRFCELEEGDWVAWQSDRRFAGATKTFRIDGVSIDQKWQVTLTLREISAADYAIADYSFANDLSRPFTTAPPPDIGAPDAGNWTLAAITLDSAGASVPALEISGNAADDPYVQAIIFEYWKADGVTDPTIAPDLIAWTSAGSSSAPDTSTVDITSIAGGATYYAAVSYIVDGVTGERLVLGPVTVSGLTTTTLRTADTTTITADDTTHSVDLA